MNMTASQATKKRHSKIDSFMLQFSGFNRRLKIDEISRRGLKKIEFKS